MEHSSLVLEQLNAFLESLILGIVLGACFDVYRALWLQKKRRRPSLGFIVADCLFWVGAAAACIMIVYARRWGEIYFYTYLSLAIGFSGYIYFISRYLLPLWTRFFHRIFFGLARLGRFLKKAGKIIAVPVLKLIRGRTPR